MCAFVHNHRSLVYCFAGVPLRHIRLKPSPTTYSLAATVTNVQQYALNNNSMASTDHRNWLA